MLCRCTISPRRISAVVEPMTAPYLSTFWPALTSQRAILNPRCTSSLKVTGTLSMVTTSPSVRFVRAMTTLSFSDNSSSRESEHSVMPVRQLTPYRGQGYTDEANELLPRRDLYRSNSQLMPAGRYFQHA